MTNIILSLVVVLCAIPVFPSTSEREGQSESKREHDEGMEAYMKDQNPGSPSNYGLPFGVTPAKAGVQSSERTWIPASAGMTERMC
jgi:hypothetical protein